MTQDKVTVTQADIDCANDVLSLWEDICAADKGAQIIARHRTHAEAEARKSASLSPPTVPRGKGDG